MLVACDQGQTQIGDDKIPQGPESIVLNNDPPQKPKDGFPYDMKRPVKKYMLPGSLEEISGLSWHREGELVSVQDEKGYLFFYDLVKGKMDRKVKFGKNGDYEGVEFVDSVMWTVKSNGNLTRIPKFVGPEVKGEKFETLLNSEDNIEGLGYDPYTKKLLIACKDNSGQIIGETTLKKAIMEYDPAKGEMSPEPVYVIDPEELAKFKGDEKPKKFFPSGIAIHPSRSEVYIISAVSNRLLVLERESGEILFFKKLKSKSFKQAEGICFTPEGTMYISNEGAGGKANILEFPMLQ